MDHLQLSQCDSDRNPHIFYQMTLDYHILPDLYCNMEAYLVQFYNKLKLQ